MSPVENTNQKHDTKMKTEHRLVTPAEAKHLLSFNAINRPLRENHVEMLLHAMSSGDWRLTHQGIAVTGPNIKNPGRLLDGQHRLNAIVRYGHAAELTISYSASPESFMSIDRGSSRTVSDVLGITTSAVGTCAAFLHFQGDKVKPTPDEILRAWHKLQPFYDMLLTTTSPRLSGSAVKAGFILKMIENPDDAEQDAMTFSMFVHRQYKSLPDSLTYLIKLLDTSPARGGGRSAVVKTAVRTVRALDSFGTKIIRDSDALDRDIARRFRMALSA